MGGEGDSKVAAKIEAPDNGYSHFSASALVNGKLFIFGGKYGDANPHTKELKLFLRPAGRPFQIFQREISPFQPVNLS